MPPRMPLARGLHHARASLAVSGLPEQPARHLYSPGDLAWYDLEMTDKRAGREMFHTPWQNSTQEYRERKETMTDALPVLPISQEQLQRLIAAMLVYQRYRYEKTPPTEEQLQTLSILEYLIPKLSQWTVRHEETMPLWLTVDDVCVIKGGLDVLIEKLKGEPSSGKIDRELQNLQKLQIIIQQFKTTLD